MVALLAGSIIAFQTRSPYPDRGKFLLALKRLPFKSPKEKVLKALGKPDKKEAWSKNDDSEVWLYGTDGTKVATLARFMMVGGKLASLTSNSPPPPTSVISEAQLRRGIHLVLDSMPAGEGSSSMDTPKVAAWVVRTTDSLLPLGEAKCKAIIGECARVMQGFDPTNPCPFLLLYSLFDPPRSPGYFATSHLIWDAPEPVNHLEQPRWPVEIVNNVLVIHGKSRFQTMGPVGNFRATFHTLRNQIHLRRAPISLSN